MEYVIVRITAKVSPRILVENEEVKEAEYSVRKTMRYELLFPADAIEDVERELRAVVKRTKDRLKKLIPLRLGNLELYPAERREQIIGILEQGKEEYWKALERLAEMHNVDLERLQQAMYFKYNVFSVYLPQQLVAIQALETVVQEIRGLRDFLAKYEIPQEHRRIVERASEIVDDELPDDIKEAFLKILSIALAGNGKTRQRARTVLEKLKQRVGDSPMTRLLEELLDADSVDEAIRKVAEVIAERKFAGRISELEARERRLREQLNRLAEEKRRVEEEAKRKIEELRAKVERLAREKEELEKAHGEAVKQKAKRLNLELDEIELELRGVKRVAEATNNAELLKGIEEIELRLERTKEGRGSRLRIEL